MIDLFQRTIPEVLGISADKWPDKDAFVQGKQRLTYSQLVDKSRKLASTLVHLGVKKGDRIGVFLPQTVESAVAIYGVMTAGAIFVPIDPTSPTLRMKEVLNRCGVSVLITHPAKKNALEAYLDQSSNKTTVIGLDQFEHANAAEVISWDEVYEAQLTRFPHISVQDLAYIMWTSGSTGSPKGMTHSHGNGLIYAGMLAETHGLNADDRFLGLSSLHFDMSVMDYVAAPLVGGTTIVVPEPVAKLPAALTKTAAEEKVTIWYSVPYSMIQMLERGAMDQHDLTSLRWMIFGGEAFPIKHLRDLMERLPNARFANAFGPAETHQISSYTVENLDDENVPIPVGKPWRTLDALVLDEDDNIVPAGEIGELVVRSPSCMRGYWGDPDQTRDSFYTHHLSANMQDAYYRTGDLIRQDADGMMHFLGRRGRQVKVRGYRIELDEVEAAVNGCDGITEGAVIRSKDGLQLIAIVRQEEGGLNIEEKLLAHCRGILPTYAVPAEVYLVTSFPRTGSDKIDRTALEMELSL